MWQQIIQNIQLGDIRTLARSISIIENENEGYETLLTLLPSSSVPVIGITGAPGAGKSTLTDALIGEIIAQQKKVAVLCVDPSSPFNKGAVLGDRIRMSDWYTHPDVFIRSLGSRGSLGGLHPHIIEITDLIKIAGFDYVLVEIVGVGQSEIEISGLADITIVVVVPEGGDEIQTMKAGIMEIADIFVVNKSDRPDAHRFLKNLNLMLAPAFNRVDHPEIKVIKTVAAEKTGIKELYDAIISLTQQLQQSPEKYWLLAEKAYQLIQQRRMKDINKKELKTEIERQIQLDNFNLYRFVEEKL